MLCIQGLLHVSGYTRHTGISIGGGGGIKAVWLVYFKNIIYRWR